MSNRRKLNLDESRKARAEKQELGPVFTLEGRDYELPPSPAAGVLVGFAEGSAGNLSSLAMAVRLLFGDNADEVLQAGLSVDELGEILEKLYGDGDGDSGESSASGD